MTNKQLVEKIEKEIKGYDLSNIAQFGSGSGSMMKLIVLNYLKELKKNLK